MPTLRAVLACGCLALVSCSRTTDLGQVTESGGAAALGQGGSLLGSAAGSLTMPELGGVLNQGSGGDAPDAPRALPTCADCRYPTCESGKTTTISGTVRTPAKTNPDPLYNAVVYLPSAPIEPFAPGVTCDRCGNASGKPVAATLSGSDGSFKLEDAPAGHDITLVVQMGRWRREVKVPEIVECQDNPLPEDLTRFPRNRSEGDIPRIGLVTSIYDPEECILRKIGIDSSEFTEPTEEGRVHLFAGEGAYLTEDGPRGPALWGDAQALARYDMVILPCNSTPESAISSPGDSSTSGSAARAALADYADMGGRVFTTDLSFSWILGEGSPYANTANWVRRPEDDDSQPVLESKVDTSFPKGEALADWLQGLGATPTLGQITLNETFRRSLSVNAPTQRWLYSEAPDSLQSFTFNTPTTAAAEQQCGRFVYSSFHIAGESDMASSPIFPGECDDQPLTPQERVLEFMLFDLASCVQIDTGKPKPPVVVK